MISGVHHVAVATSDPSRLAVFYESLGLTRLKEHAFEDGRVRSVWLDLGRGSLLMLELADGAADPQPERDFQRKRPGLHLLALGIAALDRDRARVLLARNQIAVEHETSFTVYFRDPDGNRVGLSHYPDPV